MEWLLLYIPPDTFELLLDRFGFDAKRYALWGCALGMLALLAGFGAWVLRRRWPIGAIAATGPVLWLLVMLVLMPLTSAGVFATDLLVGTRPAIGGYLAVGLTYSAVLALASLFNPARQRRVRPKQPVASDLLADGLARRTALGLAGGAAIVYVGTALVAWLLPDRSDVASIVLADPQEPFPSGGIEPQSPHPNVVSTPAAGEPIPAFEAIGSTASPTPTPPVGQNTALPEPTASRELARDKDGAVIPSGRQSGQRADAITRNADFYIVTKNAGGDPLIHPQDWHLVVDGEVQRPFQLDYATLRRLPAVEVTKTLECISNMVGKPELAPFGAELISTAVWKGVPVRDILNLVGGPRAGAEWVAVLAADEYTTALPLDAIMDPRTLLVYEMNGEVLPREHGYPARLLVPDRYGMKNPKWVVGLRPMRREFLDWYGQRQWSRTGVVKTMTRIDAPPPRAQLPSADQVVGGIAYAGSRGIQKVEFSTDGGESWQVADLIDTPKQGEDRWVRWQAHVNVEQGTQVRLQARATDGSGELQTEAFSLPQPDGGSGWPRLEFRGG